MAALLEAYITNLGKYAEGQLVGETLKFPTTAEEVQSLLKRIGVDGIRYEEIFITSFDGDVSASGKLTVKAKRLLSAQKPPSASLSRTAVSKAGLLPTATIS